MQMTFPKLKQYKLTSNIHSMCIIIIIDAYTNLINIAIIIYSYYKFYVYVIIIICFINFIG